MTVKETIQEVRAAAVAGIDRFILKAKREVREHIDRQEWNAAVEARKLAKKAKKREDRARRVRAGLSPIEPRAPRSPWVVGLDNAGQVQVTRRTRSNQEGDL